MIYKIHQSLILIFGVLGVYFNSPSLVPEDLPGLIGRIFLVISFGLYAKSKERHVIWGLLGLLGLFAIIIAVLIINKNKIQAWAKTQSNTWAVLVLISILLFLFFAYKMVILGL